mmetsp:Transcript_23910/g.62349  ORF Transcript_23910/g.62349 Transcript_23910/m.62349 type:complete len:283 (-) Transcript_23910:232-1080(-)
MNLTTLSHRPKSALRLPNRPCTGPWPARRRPPAPHLRQHRRAARRLSLLPEPSTGPCRPSSSGRDASPVTSSQARRGARDTRSAISARAARARRPRSRRAPRVNAPRRRSSCHSARSRRPRARPPTPAWRPPGSARTRRSPPRSALRSPRFWRLIALVSRTRRRLYPTTGRGPRTANARPPARRRRAASVESRPGARPATPRCAPGPAAAASRPARVKALAEAPWPRGPRWRRRRAPAVLGVRARRTRGVVPVLWAALAVPWPAPARAAARRPARRRRRRRP